MAPKTAKLHKDHFFIVEDDKGRREVLLRDPCYSIGRQKECNILLHSQFVSRRHATLLRCLAEDGSSYYRIVDGTPEGPNSANGLLINGSKATDKDLEHGDEIVFGPQVFAIYQYRQRDVFPTMPPDDPFDITLIDPAMTPDDGEDFPPI